MSASTRHRLTSVRVAPMSTRASVHSPSTEANIMSVVSSMAGVSSHSIQGLMVCALRGGWVAVCCCSSVRKVAILQAQVMGRGIAQHLPFHRRQRPYLLRGTAAVQEACSETLPGTHQAAGTQEHVVLDHRAVHDDGAHADEAAVADAAGMQEALVPH